MNTEILDFFPDEHAMSCEHKQALHNEEFDAYYCPSCMRWLEPTCEDLECEFCSKRPEIPPV